MVAGSGREYAGFCPSTHRQWLDLALSERDYSFDFRLLGDAPGIMRLNLCAPLFNNDHRHRPISAKYAANYRPLVRL
jgi:hypothetical protein